MSETKFTPGYCVDCGGPLDNIDLQLDLRSHSNKWDCINTLRAEIERLTADLSTCQDGNVDLLNENHELKRQVFALTTELGERTKSLKAANEMVNAWSDAAIQQNAKVNTLTAERDAADSRAKTYRRVLDRIIEENLDRLSYSDVLDMIDKDSQP